MNVLIVYWHPEPASFNAAMLRTATKTLKAQGHQVQVSDLGAQRFNPVSGRHNFCTAANPEYFAQQAEEANAAAHCSFAADIEAELQKLEWCDLLMFQFPLWWFAMPAIMKGWIDRVFTYSRCYDAGHQYASGHCNGKRALLCLTTGAAASCYEADGAHGTMAGVLQPIHRGVLAFTGFQVLAPFIAYAPANLSEPERIDLLAQYAVRLQQIERESPIEIAPFGNV